LTQRADGGKNDVAQPFAAAKEVRTTVTLHRFADAVAELGCAMKTTFAFVTAALLILTCGCRDKQPSDASLRSKLTGAWGVTLINPDGSSNSNGTFNVATDNQYQTEVFTLVSNEVRQVTVQGIVGVEDGFLVKTITNIIDHWRPESSSTGHVTLRQKIVRISEEELTVETNEFSRVVYSRIKQ
jgi:hypothetical protein